MGRQANQYSGPPEFRLLRGFSLDLNLFDSETNRAMNVLIVPPRRNNPKHDVTTRWSEPDRV